MDEQVDLRSDRYAESNRPPSSETTGGCETTCVPVFDPAFGPKLNPEPRILNPPSVLDLGCGMGLSGTIAAALGARVLFADIEPPALLFARLNSLPWASRVRARKLNWRTDRLDERFDLIIGADILYERAQWEYQEPFLRHHLAPGGNVLLGEPGRQTGDSFIDWIKPRGWTLEIFPEKVPTREKPVRIFRLRRFDS
jgi:2-polyprenyl-3-methyl-5-hydroxy-6-metoxy-1,4-benzoquinol methylase